MIFNRLKDKAKRDEDTGKGASSYPSKKKNKQRREASLMAATDHKGFGSPPRAPRTTSRSCSKDYVRTMLSLLSIYTRTVVS